VRGRSPLFQSWFDIQPVSLEGDAFTLEGLETRAFGEVRPCPAAAEPLITCIARCASVARSQSAMFARTQEDRRAGPLLKTSVPQADKEMAKMDLELWMQEDGTGIFGAVLYSEDIFDEATAQGVAAHVLVSPRIGLARKSS